MINDPLFLEVARQYWLDDGVGVPITIVLGVLSPFRSRRICAV